MRFDDFLHLVCPPLDLNWRKYRRRAARHRVNARMQELNITGYEHYLDYLQKSPEEAAGLADCMRVTVSRFFREYQRWETVSLKVLPHLLNNKSSDNELRIWSVGCCGGEEPYTLAMLWLGTVQTIRPDLKINILATDIDDASLDRAQKHLYTKQSLRETPKFLFKIYCTKRGHQWKVNDEVTNLIHFKKHNLMDDPLPTGIDFICSRYYVFTYYTGQRLVEAATKLHQCLNPDGALMIGRKESLGMADQLFTPWPEAPGIFKPVFSGSISRGVKNGRKTIKCKG